MLLFTLAFLLLIVIASTTADPRLSGRFLSNQAGIVGKGV